MLLLEAMPQHCVIHLCQLISCRPAAKLSRLALPQVQPLCHDQQLMRPVTLNLIYRYMDRKLSS